MGIIVYEQGKLVTIHEFYQSDSSVGILIFGKEKWIISQTLAISQSVHLALEKRKISHYSTLYTDPTGKSRTAYVSTHRLESIQEVIDKELQKIADRKDPYSAP